MRCYGKSSPTGSRTCWTSSTKIWTPPRRCADKAGGMTRPIISFGPTARGPDHDDALILVGASGFSYEEAAAICDCAVGTIKSRVNRARTRLSDLLSIDGADDFGPDHTTRAILSAGGRG